MGFSRGPCLRLLRRHPVSSEAVLGAFARGSTSCTTWIDVGSSQKPLLLVRHSASALASRCPRWPSLAARSARSACVAAHHQTAPILTLSPQTRQADPNARGDAQPPTPGEALLPRRARGAVQHRALATTGTYAPPAASLKTPAAASRRAQRLPARIPAALLTPRARFRSPLGRLQPSRACWRRAPPPRPSSPSRRAAQRSATARPARPVAAGRARARPSPAQPSPSPAQLFTAPPPSTCPRPPPASPPPRLASGERPVPWVRRLCPPPQARGRGGRSEPRGSPPHHS